jgi:Flp pilus assembly protein TadG
MAGHSGALDGDDRGAAAMKGFRPFWRRAEGSVAVEAGLVLPVLLLLVVGTFELGRIFWTHNTMLLAVEEAGRYAMTYRHGSAVTCAAQQQTENCPSPSDTALANCSAARAQQILFAYQNPEIRVSASEDTTTSPSSITVCASYSFEFIAPRLLPYGPLNLTSRVTVPLI